MLSSEEIEAKNEMKERTCADTSFCERLRVYKPDVCPFNILSETVKITDSKVDGKIINRETQALYKFSLNTFVDSTFRLTINEEEVHRPRFQATLALGREPSALRLIKTSEGENKLYFETITNKVILFFSPFKIEIYNGQNKDELALIVNERGRLMVEYNQQKTSDSWEENFDGFVDSRPFGPMAVALDFDFPQATNFYGLSQHAESLSLKTTTDSDPYRLFNLDKPAYELYSKKSMYGAVPFVIAHGANNTVGVFWLNAAETWVDIDKQIALASNKANMNTFFMSETGMLDVFFTMGPQFSNVNKQFSRLTGPALFPPYFSLGYHQSRWNYEDEKDLMTVAENFDKYDIPLDVMWLDIEYTDSKKYFTWDPEKFKHPERILGILAAMKRKLVVIIDPHIKVDNSYFVYRAGVEKGLFVKNRNGSNFVGHCWPEASCYLDFINPQTREYYALLHLLENFRGTTKDVFFWNDMNEPSVFDGPEKTLPKDVIHQSYHVDWEHRDIHNMYGFLQVMSTYEGLLKRSNRTSRPFILTRSHFAGVQRYAAVWTGDNSASWEYLKISVPMCLSSALSGISFCGADVGGFFENPDSQLMSRWYQAAVYLPFFRQHSFRETPRREPWLFDNTTMHIIRAAIQERQSLLPFWYTLFYQYSEFGAPVIHPVVTEFPKETATFDIDYEFLLGESILVRPITEPDVSKVNVYFPGKDDVWYNKETYASVTAKGVQSVDVTLNEIPVFFRSGYIIPMRKSIRSSAIKTLNDPLTLVVALNKQGNASGHLFVDDGESFAYQENNYIYLLFEFHNKKITSRFVNDARFETNVWIEKIIIFEISNIFKRATVTFKSNEKKELEIKYNACEYGYTVHSNSSVLSLTEEWTIIFE